eukprot:scaffold22139_cov146-Isochrysis_galbana.AAC.3
MWPDAFIPPAGEQAAGGVVVGWLVDPDHRLTQPVPLARGRRVLEGGVDGVGWLAQPLRQPRNKVVVSAAKQGERQHPADHLGLPLALVRGPPLACDPVELALVPPRARVLPDEPAPLQHQRQRRRPEEHVTDVVGGVDGTVVLEPAVGGGVGQVVRRGQEAGVWVPGHVREGVAQDERVYVGDDNLQAPENALVDELDLVRAERLERGRAPRPLPLGQVGLHREARRLGLVQCLECHVVRRANQKVGQAERLEVVNPGRGEVNPDAVDEGQNDRPRRPRRLLRQTLAELQLLRQPAAGAQTPARRRRRFVVDAAHVHHLDVRIGQGGHEPLVQSRSAVRVRRHDAESDCAPSEHGAVCARPYFVIFVAMVGIDAVPSPKG